MTPPRMRPFSPTQASITSQWHILLPPKTTDISSHLAGMGLLECGIAWSTNSSLKLTRLTADITLLPCHTMTSTSLLETTTHMFTYTVLRTERRSSSSTLKSVACPTTYA